MAKNEDSVPCCHLVQEGVWNRLIFSQGNLFLFHKDQIALRPDPTFILKVNSAFHRSQDLHLPFFCPNPKHQKWHTLDFRRALKYCLQQINFFRKTDAMFISISLPKKGQKVSRLEISNTIKVCIIEAYKDLIVWFLRASQLIPFRVLPPIQPSFSVLPLKKSAKQKPGLHYPCSSNFLNSTHIVQLMSSLLEECCRT